MVQNKNQIIIIGAGLAGLSAAKTLAERGAYVCLVSVQPSERAQSNLAEGGINAALNVMGEDDTVFEHFEDTMKGGCYLADPGMVKGLVEEAPGIVRSLADLGVPFHREEGRLIQRSFGGQRKKRTAYAKSSTGKVLTVALIDAVRRLEAEGLVQRLCHHRFEKLLMDGSKCRGAWVYDLYEKKMQCLDGTVLMACGGYNGMFPGITTGTTANTGTAAAILFSQGVRFANLEFIQYHPTTVAITGKRLLISEAARGEGGRLFYEKEDGSRCYFLEEKYGERGNLMPRDVISREMAALGVQAYLDLANLPENTWEKKLSDLREEIIHYMGIEPKKNPVPVSPGIHYFMGGIDVDARHRTNLEDLYAAGECACAYHGANRLGGNSLLGAIYGGKKAAEGILEGLAVEGDRIKQEPELRADSVGHQCVDYKKEQEAEERMEVALRNGLGIRREAAAMEEALFRIPSYPRQEVSRELWARCLFARAMLYCALNREESRGAHTRLDYPESQESYRKKTIAEYDGDSIRVSLQEIPDAGKED